MKPTVTKLPMEGFTLVEEWQNFIDNKDFLIDKLGQEEYDRLLKQIEDELKER